MVCAAFGFNSSFVVTGQTYPRKVDAQVINSLAGIAASVHKFATNPAARRDEADRGAVRGGAGRLNAMAYKRNPMRCERATGLARFVISLASSPLQTAAEQWFERTLDDSSNKRLAIPEPFWRSTGRCRSCMNVRAGWWYIPR